MFTAQDVLLDVGFADARALLVNLITGGTLTCASQVAYREGLASLAGVGLPAASKLARVRFLSPADRADGMAPGCAGRLPASPAACSRSWMLTSR